MSKKNIQKNIKLSLEFDTYISKHPRMLKSLPRGASVILASSSDKRLSKANYAIARSSKSGKFVVASKTGSSWKIESLPRAK